MQPVYLYPRPLGTFHNGPLFSTVRSVDSSIMRICEFKTLSPRRAQTISIFCFFAFHVQCWPVPPLHFVLKLVTARSALRGNVWGKGRSRGKFILRSKIWIFIHRQNMIHTSHPDNRPPSDKYTLLSLALDFPHISCFYWGLLAIC